MVGDNHLAECGQRCSFVGLGWCWLGIDTDTSGKQAGDTAKAKHHEIQPLVLACLLPSCSMWPRRILLIVVQYHIMGCYGNTRLSLFELTAVWTLSTF
jgi:hypothetical protein